MEYYLVAKALHIISVIAWMCGMLYLPRLYVYHAGMPVGSAASEIFKVMERRLLRAIINPAMIASWGFGLWLIWINAGESMDGLKEWMKTNGWMHAKLTLLVLMQLVHAYLARTRRHFANDRRPSSATTFRIVNEIPTVLMIGIVFLVMLKPF